jgi:hypothetical protein
MINTKGSKRRIMTDNVANQTLSLLRELRNDFATRMDGFTSRMDTFEMKLSAVATVQLHQAIRLDKIDGRLEKMETDLHYLANHVSLVSMVVDEHGRRLDKLDNPPTPRS